MAQRKILIITNRIPYPLKDGGNLAMNVMIDGYSAAGWQVYLLAMNTSRHHVAAGQLKDLFTNLYRFEWMDVNNDVNPVGLVKNFFLSKEPEHAERFYKHDFEEKIAAIVRSFKPDVVQMESVYLATYLPCVKQLTDAVTVLRMHNVEYQIWQGLAKKNKNIKKFYLENLATRVRNFERDAWRSFDLLLPITEKDASLVLRIEDVNDLLVVPFGIDLGKIKPGENESWVGYHIGAMDWLANQEGINWFVEKVWPKVHKAVPKFEFYFAGRNMPDAFNHLKATGIHCMNEVQSAEEFIADKKILIVPLLSGGGIRVKILEAMAAGKIVITTRVGIRGIEARAGEHFLQANTPDDFARAIKWCFDNKEDAEKITEKALHLVKEKYERKKVMEMVVRKIEVLLGGREQD